MISPDTTNLTAEQQALFRHIDGLIPEDGHLVYDLRDPKQYEFAKMMHELSGFDAARYPGFHRLLDDIRDHQHKNGCAAAAPAQDNASTWQNTIAIPLIGQDPAQLAAAEGMGTIVGGFTSMNLALYVQDPTTSTILAKGSIAAWQPNVILGVTTDTGTAKKATTSMVAYLNYSYQAKTSVTAPGASGVVKRIMPQGALADPVVTHPARNCTKPHNPNAINIGLGRYWPDQGNDMDYVWKEPNKDHPQGRIPFVGNVQFSKPIQALQRDINFTVMIRVADGTGGGTNPPIEPTDMTNVYNNFSINPNNPKMLQWNLPPGINDLNTGNPITFTNITWPSDMLSYFYCDIQVTFTDGTLGFASIISSNDPDQDPFDGTTYIMPIEFMWHCLAEGTRVTLADGTSKLIEEILRDDRVVAANNGRECVTATTRGKHHGRAVQITTAKGQSLILSEKHVVMTTRGGVPANELQLGDKVIIRQGYADLIEVQEVKYEGLMYNLYLGGHQDHTAADATLRTYFANDILVGDVRSQRALIHRRSLDKEWIKAQSGEYWAVDIESHFADMEKKKR